MKPVSDGRKTLDLSEIFLRDTWSPGAIYDSQPGWCTGKDGGFRKIEGTRFMTTAIQTHSNLELQKLAYDLARRGMRKRVRCDDVTQIRGAIRSALGRRTSAVAASRVTWNRFLLEPACAAYENNKPRYRRIRSVLDWMEGLTFVVSDQIPFGTIIATGSPEMTGVMVNEGPVALSTGGAVFRDSVGFVDLDRGGTKRQAGSR